MSGNETPFISVMKEVIAEGQSQEALSFKVLKAMIDMEATFHTEWLKDYHANASTRGHQATKIREVLTELLGETYKSILDDCAIKDKDARTDPTKLLNKQLATKKRVNLDNRVRMCLDAIVFFRINPLNKEGLKVNNVNKTAAFGTSDGIQYKGLTFTDVQQMSKSVIASQGWVPQPATRPAANNGTTVAQGGNPTVAPNVSVTEENKDKLLVATVQATEELIRKADQATLSKEAVIAIIQLAKSALKKQFGNAKGKIELEDLALDFAGLFVHKDGKPVCLVEQKKVA